MLSKSMFPILLAVFAMAAHAGQDETRQSLVVMDEDVWVTFYDLPSRRFRAIRSAILTRDFDTAARDLTVTANYLSVEAERSSGNLRAPLDDVVGRLRSMAPTVDTVSLGDLDALFGRAHWLLAQHFLVLALKARDARQSRNASLYIQATTHHLERAMLWSNVPVSRDVYATLDGLRKLAEDLKNPATAERAYRERPVVRADALLRKIGTEIDRRVLIPPAPAVTPEAQSATPQPN